MFGDPVARVTKPLGMLREIETLPERFARCFTKNDGSEIEYGDGNHACDVA